MSCLVLYLQAAFTYKMWTLQIGLSVINLIADLIQGLTFYSEDHLFLNTVCTWIIIALTIGIACCKPRQEGKSRSFFGYYECLIASPSQFILQAVILMVIEKPADIAVYSKHSWEDGDGLRLIQGFSHVFGMTCSFVSAILKWWNSIWGIPLNFDMLTNSTGNNILVWNAFCLSCLLKITKITLISIIFV